MTQAQFLSNTKKWLKHKTILANSSHWYKIPFRKAALAKTQDAFYNFLTAPKYSALELAIKLKRNENVLEILLPIPSNPSYENSAFLLKQLIQTAEILIKQYNIQL